MMRTMPQGRMLLKCRAVLTRGHRVHRSAGVVPADRRAGKGVTRYMTFIKCKTGLFMFLLIFMLSGCGNNEPRYGDNSQPSVTEQPDTENKKTVISRARSVSDVDDYFEQVNTESKLGINDILESENEFLISDDWEKRIIYIYQFSDKGYEKYIFSLDYAEQESVNIYIQNNIKEMYVLCPEYTNVEAITKCNASSAEEHSLYVVDEEGNRVEVGGSPRYRIFGIDVSTRENIEFKLCDALESDDYMTYGGFTIKLE